MSWAIIGLEECRRAIFIQSRQKEEAQCLIWSEALCQITEPKKKNLLGFSSFCFFPLKGSLLLVSICLGLAAFVFSPLQRRLLVRICLGFSSFFSTNLLQNLLAIFTSSRSSCLSLLYIFVEIKADFFFFSSPNESVLQTSQKFCQLYWHDNWAPLILLTKRLLFWLHTELFLAFYKTKFCCWEDIKTWLPSKEMECWQSAAIIRGITTTCKGSTKMD